MSQHPSPRSGPSVTGHSWLPAKLGTGGLPHLQTSSWDGWVKSPVLNGNRRSPSDLASRSAQWLFECLSFTLWTNAGDGNAWAGWIAALILRWSRGGSVPAPGWERCTARHNPELWESSSLNSASVAKLSCLDVLQERAWSAPVGPARGWGALE